jgi:hypothetical protein
MGELLTDINSLSVRDQIAILLHFGKLPTLPIGKGDYADSLKFWGGFADDIVSLFQRLDWKSPEEVGHYGQVLRIAYEVDQRAVIVQARDAGRKEVVDYINSTGGFWPSALREITVEMWQKQKQKWGLE